MNLINAGKKSSPLNGGGACKIVTYNFLRLPYVVHPWQMMESISRQNRIKKECVVATGMWYALQCAMLPQGGANTFFYILLTGEHSKKMVGMKPSRIFSCLFKWQALVIYLYIYILLCAGVSVFACAHEIARYCTGFRRHCWSIG